MKNEKPFNVIQAECPEFYEWLKEISRFSKVEDFVLPDYKNGTRVFLYTHNYEYCIKVRIPEVKKMGGEKMLSVDGYLGCTVQNRKQVAGEDWNRGRDLADGKYCYETWQEIKNDIIAFELVKVANKVQLQTIKE